MRTTTMYRHILRAGLAVFGGFAALAVASDARAQVAGSAGRPLPNVLLLVDNSGSMERKPNNQLPNCSRGNSTSEVNRWGMLLQAMTGNFQPYFSCDAVSRSSANFNNRYSINGIAPYDKDYFLPYNQPMTGAGADACVIAPWKLPGAGAGAGVGINRLGAGGVATDYPDEALAAFKYDALGGGLPASLTGNTNVCLFDQNNDGQLDVSKAYARFALMTFDSLTDPQRGVTGAYPTEVINTADPFKGQWSYLRPTGAPFETTASNTSALLGIGAQGAPGTNPKCDPTWQEVGARNAAAPPWEGRLVGFPDPDATLYDLEARNALIQQTLLATRPFGATPIDGLMDDARNYLYHDPQGPKDDPYACRDKYIILLTDGAPNLSLRPSCTQTNGTCPYPKQAHENAHDLFTLPEAQKVTTFVIGFSVNGSTGGANNDGFPTGLANNDCKTWFDQAAGGATDELTMATNMQNACAARNPEPGTTGDACCQLNRIALEGSNSGAFFAESQADIVLAFGRIMANIIHSASTKTVPAFAQTTPFATTTFTSSLSAAFNASYIPSTQTPWAGELDRTRNICIGSPPVPTGQAPTRNLGDFQSENLSVQSNAKQRIFISAVADTYTSAIDSAATIRPFAAGGDGIGNPGTTGPATYAAKEVVMKGVALNFEPDWTKALNITGTTCKSGRAVARGASTSTRGTTLIPALDVAQDCTDVVWSFATANPDPLPKKGYDFNVRCSGSGGTASGKCSVSGNACVTANPTACGKGESCIPDCAALGAIYHSSPAISPPPFGTLREEGFRNYQAKYQRRRTMLYAATTDGLLHAFDAMLQGPASSRHEQWSFAPPAVLPRLAANYPGGNQIILDGAPVVRETVWDRTAAQNGDPKKWHTTLVAGLGTLGGYYALNVTDADCTGGVGVDHCFEKYEAPAKGVKADIGLPIDAAGTEGTPKPGPHFLWQITDVPKETSDTAKDSRTSTVGSPTKTPMVSLFGRNTSTPAIGTVQTVVASVQHQVGIAVLPGGYDEPPVRNGECDRVAKPSDVNISDIANGAVRLKVRQWSRAGCNAAVPGRNVTIVRLDTGEVLRVFGRNIDTPLRLQPKVGTETMFDSPMVGTPVVYPDEPGVPIQKIFIGDADGTLWMIDVRNLDPAQWKAYLFADLIGKATTPSAAQSSPIQVPPVVSTDEAGNVIVNVATGDQESIVASDTLENFVYSIREKRDGIGAARAEVLWYKRLSSSERVTGPMTVFDKTLYFATYQPIRPVGNTVAACDGPGRAYLWGMSYNLAKGSITAANGGADRWCPGTNNVDAVTGLCNVGLVDREGQGSDLIPGVALQSTRSCVGAEQPDGYGNTMFSSVTQASFSLTFGRARANNEDNNKAQSARGKITRPLPRSGTLISSWSLVLE